MADRVPLGAGDRHADFGGRAGGGRGELPGQSGVNQAEALDLAWPVGQPEQCRQRDYEVRRTPLARLAARR
jgi:hypothetical protein